MSFGSSSLIGRSFARHGTASFSAGVLINRPLLRLEASEPRTVLARDLAGDVAELGPDQAAENGRTLEKVVLTDVAMRAWVARRLGLSVNDSRLDALSTIRKGLVTAG